MVGRAIVVNVLAHGFDAKAAARHVKLLCLDLDGTLLDPVKQISVGNRAAIKRACAAGLHVAIASGRHPFNISELLDDLGLPHDAVCLSGAYAMLGGSGVFRHELDHEAVAAAVEVARAFDGYISLAGSDFNLTAGLVNRGKGGTTPAMQRYLHFDTYDDLLLAACERRGRVLKAALHVESDEAYAQLRDAIDQIPDIACAQSDTRWVDVTAQGCTKAEGIDAMARTLGFPLDEVAAVGDDENDVESLGAVGLGIAMGNALPVARAAAKASVADNAHDGVAEAIDFILQAQA